MESAVDIRHRALVSLLAGGIDNLLFPPKDVVDALVNEDQLLELFLRDSVPAHDTITLVRTLCIRSGLPYGGRAWRDAILVALYKCTRVCFSQVALAKVAEAACRRRDAALAGEVTEQLLAIMRVGAYSAAVASGDVDVFNAVVPRAAWSSAIFKDAARGPNAHIVRRMLEGGFVPSSPSIALREAATCGCIDSMNAILDRFPTTTHRLPALDAAVRTGRGDKVRLLLQRCARTTLDTIFKAAHCGHGEIVDMLLASSPTLVTKEQRAILKRCLEEGLPDRRREPAEWKITCPHCADLGLLPRTRELDAMSGFSAME